MITFLKMLDGKYYSDITFMFILLQKTPTGIYAGTNGMLESIDIHLKNMGEKISKAHAANRVILDNKSKFLEPFDKHAAISAYRHATKAAGQLYCEFIGIQMHGGRTGFKLISKEISSQKIIAKNYLLNEDSTKLQNLSNSFEKDFSIYRTAPNVVRILEQSEILLKNIATNGTEAANLFKQNLDNVSRATLMRRGQTR